jgi:hypothetical protein
MLKVFIYLLVEKEKYKEHQTNANHQDVLVYVDRIFFDVQQQLLYLMFLKQLMREFE